MKNTTYIFEMESMMNATLQIMNKIEKRLIKHMINYFFSSTT